MSPAEKPEQDVQTGVDRDGRGLSLQCVCPGMPLRLAANLSHPGLGWGSGPGDQEPSRASIRSLSPRERAQAVQAWVRARVSAAPSLFPQLSRGGEVFIISSWEASPWPGAESDFWFGVDSGPRGWHSLPSPKHPSTLIGLLCLWLEPSPC